MTGNRAHDLVLMNETSPLTLSHHGEYRGNQYKEKKWQFVSTVCPNDATYRCTLELAEILTLVIRNLAPS